MIGKLCLLSKSIKQGDCLKMKYYKIVLYSAHIGSAEEDHHDNNEIKDHILIFPCILLARVNNIILFCCNSFDKFQQGANNHDYAGQANGNSHDPVWHNDGFVKSIRSFI